MPHKCARCGGVYDDGAAEIITGCGCGSKVFLFLRKDYAGTPEATIQVLKERAVDDRDLTWLDNEFKDRLKGPGTVSLDIENVLRVDEGKFQLNIERLMSGEPVVIKASEGVYYIDLPYSMKSKRQGGRRWATRPSGASHTAR